MKMEKLIEKASVLVEALPFIQKFRNSLALIKLGGSIMEDPELVASAMCDVVLLEAIGIRPIIVHGGGKAISAELKRQEIPVKFVNGLRYTDEKTISIVDDVLHNVVNAQLLELGNKAGGRMKGISGKQVLRAERTLSVDPATGKAEDVGFVGKVAGVDVSAIIEAMEAGFIPVVTPLGTGNDGQVYNINADTAASEIAKALKVRKLVFVSDVPGVLADKEDESSVIPTISTPEIDGLASSGVLAGGMLPKIRSCAEALSAGINKVHLIDGRLHHSLLLEIFTNNGVGTQIVRPDSVM